MPKTAKHMQASTMNAGRDMAPVHGWVDHPDLKDERHDLTRIPVMAKVFERSGGPLAVREYVRHVADDLKSKLGHLSEDLEGMLEALRGTWGQFTGRVEPKPSGPRATWPSGMPRWCAASRTRYGRFWPTSE
jgi:hypothetical protein